MPPRRFRRRRPLSRRLPAGRGNLSPGPLRWLKMSPATATQRRSRQPPLGTPPQPQRQAPVRSPTTWRELRHQPTQKPRPPGQVWIHPRILCLERGRMRGQDRLPERNPLPIRGVSMPPARQLPPTPPGPRRKPAWIRWHSRVPPELPEAVAYPVLNSRCLCKWLRKQTDFPLRRSRICRFLLQAVPGRNCRSSRSVQPPSCRVPRIRNIHQSRVHRHPTRPLRLRQLLLSVNLRRGLP